MKKVQRAARSAGTRSVSRPKPGFPMLVGVIILLGTALVAYARADFRDQTTPQAPTKGEQWFHAYGVFACDEFVAPLAPLDPKTSDLGGADGIIRANEFSPVAAGEPSRLGTWAESVGLLFAADSITLPDGTTFKNGDDCSGSPGEVVVARWDDARTVNDADPDIVLRSDFGSLAFTGNGTAVLVAFIPTGADLPRPPVTQLGDMGDLADGQAPPFDPDELPSPTAPVPVTGVPTTGSSVPAGTAPGSTSPDGGAATTIAPATTSSESTSPETTAVETTDTTTPPTSAPE